MDSRTEPRTGGSTDLVMRRIFEAPIARVFSAWTDPEHFAAWFGPHGSRMTVCLQDVRPGGQLHFCHHLPDRPEVWVRGIYHEVVAPTLLSFSVGFSDPQGQHAPRDGFADLSLVTVQFRDLGGRTEMIIRHAGLRTDQGEGQGWRESLDRLRNHLTP
ncbi:SRPBCC family protein [Arenimonas daejeonensis]|uniref:SRPBCC family protein n=1 Tax=Arenimonas daejeonensis TaxID=370777 RepID=UPI0011BDA76D|nr:SRPBCC domain-containing protein [Arenimonas daejeonensis]